MRRLDELPEQSIEHFRSHGWMRIVQAFDADAALRMRDAIWRALSLDGIHHDRPSTWTVERPVHLQHLKRDPIFQAVGSARLLEAMDVIFNGRAYEVPKDWGALFVAFPSVAEWVVPTSGWHIDANYTSRLWPVSGIKTLSLLGDVVPRGGGTQVLNGSHRLVHRWFRENPPPPGTRSAEMRRRLQAHPYIRDLHSAGDPGARIARFMERVEYVDDIPLRVIETTGAAGDVYLLHPLLLHVAATNSAAQPRFLLSGGITTDTWGWDKAAQALS